MTARDDLHELLGILAELLGEDRSAAQARTTAACVAGYRSFRPIGDTPHGTTTGYTNYACRCDPCKAAQLAYQREYRQRPASREKRRLQLRAWRERQQGPSHINPNISAPTSGHPRGAHAEVAI